MSQKATEAFLEKLRFFKHAPAGLPQSAEDILTEDLASSIIVRF